MSTDDPSSKPPDFSLIPVSGAESAPSGLVDYVYWQMRRGAASLILGRYEVLPPPVRADGHPSRAGEMEVKVSFVAHMTPGSLRSLRYAIDQALEWLDRPEEPPPPPQG